MKRRKSKGAPQSHGSSKAPGGVRHVANAHGSVGPRKAYGLDRFFDYSLDMLCIAGMDGMFKRINPSFVRVLGWSEEELLSRRFVSFVHPDDVQKTLKEMEGLAQGKPTVAFENRYQCADGSYRYLSWTSFPEQNTQLLYAVARDISNEKQDQEKLERLTEELEQANARLLEIATTDPLTRISNRRKFDSDANTLIQLMCRMRRPISLIMADIDHFKQLNDRHGHLVGDSVLATVATLLYQSGRESDLVARFGGEEFIVLLPDTGAVPSVEAAENIRSRVLRHSWLHEPVTISIGVTTFDPAGEKSIDAKEIETQLIAEADQALYRSKHHGRNQVNHFSRIRKQ